MGPLLVSLFILSAILFLIEVLIPGFGVFGISSILLFIVASLLTITYAPYGFELFIGIAIILIFSIYKLIQYLKCKQFYKNIISDEPTILQKTETTNLSHLLDKDGITKTSLRPYGTAEFNGLVFDVCSNGDFIEKATRVRITSVENNKIVVKVVN
jgi:membrane-bound serine protease (ClpP class)